MILAFKILIAAANVDAVVIIAKKVGFSIPVDLMRKAQSASELGENRGWGGWLD